MTTPIQDPTQDGAELLDMSNPQPLSAEQKAQMALTLGTLYCQDKGLPLQGDNGKPSPQVAAVAASLLLN